MSSKSSKTLLSESRTSWESPFLDVIDIVTSDTLRPSCQPGRDRAVLTMNVHEGQETRGAECGGETMR